MGSGHTRGAEGPGLRGVRCGAEPAAAEGDDERECGAYGDGQEGVRRAPGNTAEKDVLGNERPVVSAPNSTDGQVVRYLGGGAKNAGRHRR